MKSPRSGTVLGRPPVSCGAVPRLAFTEQPITPTDFTVPLFPEFLRENHPLASFEEA